MKLHHRLEYSADDIPLEQVIDSLRAQQRLLKEAAELFEALAPGSQFILTSITVDELRAGSLLIDLLLEFHAAYQKQIDHALVGGLESLLGIDVPPELEAAASLAMIAVTYFVARMVYDAVWKKKKVDRPSTHIEGNYNQVINVIADRLVVSPKAVEDALGQVVHPSKFRSLVKPVADFLRPAKSQPGSNITTDGLEIPPEVISEFPSDAEIGQLVQTEIVPYPDTLIEIRALDKDRSKRGWAAKVIGNADFGDRRLPMDLYPTVDTGALANLPQVRADLQVEMVRNGKGDLVPKRLHVLAFRPLDPS